MEYSPCNRCKVLIKSYWLKDGVCNGCRNPHLIVTSDTNTKCMHDDIKLTGNFETENIQCQCGFNIPF